MDISDRFPELEYLTDPVALRPKRNLYIAGDTKGHGCVLHGLAGIGNCIDHWRVGLRLCWRGIGSSISGIHWWMIEYKVNWRQGPSPQMRAIRSADRHILDLDVRREHWSGYFEQLFRIKLLTAWGWNITAVSPLTAECWWRTHGLSIASLYLSPRSAEVLGL